MARPRLRREVFGLHEAMMIPPEVVALDSSFVVEAVVDTAAEHRECRAFLERLAEASSVVAYSPLLHLEVAEGAFTRAVKDRHGAQHARRRRRDGRIRTRAGRITTEVMAAWRQYVEIFDAATVEVDEIVDGAVELMGDYGLGSYDAAHVATAWHLEVYEFVTRDMDFAVLPSHWARLYTTASLVGSARRVRGGT